MNIALVQFDIAWGNKVQNFNKIKTLLKDTQADLFLLPEMFQTGFCVDEIQYAEEMQAETFEFMKEMARSKDALMAGTWMVKDGDAIYNRFVVVGEVGVVAYYDKVHLFKHSNEDQYISAGNAKSDLEINGKRFRLITCYDLRFPYISFNDSEYDAILISANWPSQRIKHWDALLRARAIENQAYTIAVNRVGQDIHGHYYPGHSSVYDMSGERLIRFTGEEVHVVTLDFDKQEELRKKLPFIKDRVM